AENPVFYVQYAHARIASLLAKAGGDAVSTALGAPDHGAALEGAERELVKKLLAFPEEVAEAAERRSPHVGQRAAHLRRRRGARYARPSAGDLHARPHRRPRLDPAGRSRRAVRRRRDGHAGRAHPGDRAASVARRPQRRPPAPPRLPARPGERGRRHRPARPRRAVDPGRARSGRPRKRGRSGLVGTCYSASLGDRFRRVVPRFGVPVAPMSFVPSNATSAWFPQRGEPVERHRHRTRARGGLPPPAPRGAEDAHRDRAHPEHRSVQRDREHHGPAQADRRPVADRTTPANRSEEEIAGYRAVLDLIHSSVQDIPFRPSIVEQLHRDLYQFTGVPAGRWKTVENSITQIEPDGSETVRFETAPAWETPAAMAELHESLARARGGEHHPLLVIGCSVFDLEHETTQYNPPALEMERSVGDVRRDERHAEHDARRQSRAPRDALDATAGRHRPAVHPDSGPHDAERHDEPDGWPRRGVLEEPGTGEQREHADDDALTHRAPAARRPRPPVTGARCQPRAHRWDRCESRDRSAGPVATGRCARR
ncbi:MAG: hypothetical protein H0W03_02765, partial [Solirubrobacterales bacterium]|nr:hypothetical protein [Solirubrobacterales bacterium]